MQNDTRTNTRHPHNAALKHHAFEAICVEDRKGSESLLDVFRVTRKRNADAAYGKAQDLCDATRKLRIENGGECLAVFVREINAPGEG